ncbi:hypothetical protein GCM10023196_019760 [Actinoallomurus vinaceus]|uniref:AB hydrolase-1 domain-containing protein n=1 Tax=Actinoallomurus vinaceus TaxID=1080074 RepID=A0ABP8U847_9ACTN
MGSRERLTHVNGADQCLQTFGDQGAPAVLLIAGAAHSMDWWDTRLCGVLAEGGRFVIRYDYRDTGRSASYAPGAPKYDFDDLVDDALGLLDALGLSTAHVVGASLGGGIAQRLALAHAGRLLSLTLLSTSPGIRPNAPFRDGLPPPSDDLMERLFAARKEPDWEDRAAVIDWIVEEQSALAGARRLEEAYLRRLLARVLDRTGDIAACMTNHRHIEPGAAYASRVGDISLPTLVVHGTDDPLLPFEHAVALADEISAAELLPLRDVGHQMPPPDTWDTLVAALLSHTGGS